MRWLITARRSVVALLVGTVFLSLPALARSATPQGSSGSKCPDDMVCFTIAQAADIDRKLAELELLKKKHKWYRPWGSVGITHLPETDEYDPYALGGFRFGRVSVWGGFFGDTAATGVGWSF